MQEGREAPTCTVPAGVRAPLRRHRTCTPKGSPAVRAPRRAARPGSALPPRVGCGGGARRGADGRLKSIV